MAATQPEQSTASASSSRAPGWAMLALLCAAQFMVVLDFSIVNVALPSIQSTFGISQEQLQWLISGYALTFGGFLLLGGRAADLVGRRRMFVIGLVAFAAASLLGGIAPDPTLLVAARALQGVGAAILSPSALSMVTSIFNEGRERHRALGIFGALGAGGFAGGVFLGGVLTDGPGWRWVFFVNVPIGLLVALVSPRVLPNIRPPAAERDLDIAGAITGTFGLGLLVFGLTQAPNWGWLSLWTWLCVVAAIAILVVFVRIEGGARAPILRLALLKRRSVAVANLVAMLTTAAIAPQVFVMSVYLQTVAGFSALQTGLVFLVQGITAILGAVLGSRGISRFGIRPMLVAGRLIAAIALLLLVPLSNSGVALPVLLTALGLIGLGNVCSFVASSVGATSGVEQGEQGLASGVLYSAQQVGSALGISVLIALAETRTRILQSGGLDANAALVDGFQYALAGATAISFVAALVALAAPSTTQAHNVRPIRHEDGADTHANVARAAGNWRRESGTMQVGRVDGTGPGDRKLRSR